MVGVFMCEVFRQPLFLKSVRMYIVFRSIPEGQG